MLVLSYKNKYNRHKININVIRSYTVTCMAATTAIHAMLNCLLRIRWFIYIFYKILY